jgi:hypothetical protein
MNILDGDHTLTEGAAWFKVDGFAIRIHRTDEGVVTDIFKDGAELESPIASAYAFSSELEEEDI